MRGENFFHNRLIMSTPNQVDRHVVQILNRIRRVIGNAARSYQSTSNLDYRALSTAKHNLRRISTNISVVTYNLLLDAIDGLLLLINNRQESQAYTVPRFHSNGRGRPTVQINENQLKLLYDEGYTGTAMAILLGCSKKTIYKKLYELNLLMRERYTNISQEELQLKISEIHEQHPNCGHTMMQAYLKASGIRVQRKKIRQALDIVDPIGTASRWSQSIKRRNYKVATPNSLWHMDAHLKLSRWGFVIHGCIDGFSRFIIYLKCEMSIQAQPVINHFTSAVESYGLPSRVRSDHGYENILVAFLMNIIRGCSRGSHITGKSVHNQRIERLWVDVYKEVCDSIYKELYELENDHLLDVDNLSHRFCVQFVYKSVIDKKLSSFRSAWNIHNLRTENNRTPRQLWLGGMLDNFHTNSTAVREVFDNNISLYDRLSESLQTLGVDLSTIIINNNDIDIPSSSFVASLDLTQEQNTHLINILTENKSNREKYVSCVNFLCN